MTNRTCDYCGIVFGGPGFSPDGKRRYCCYGCYLVERIMGCKGEEALAAWIVARLGAGAFLAMNVMMISLVLYTQPAEAMGAAVAGGLRWGAAILSSPAVIILGGPFIAAGIRDALRGRVGMDLLICTGCLAAYFASLIHVVAGRGQIYFDTATMLPLLITVGRLMEAAAKSTSAKAIRGALELLPKMARVMRDGIESEVCTDEIVQGDTLIIRPGERIAADGVIVSGSCLVEEAAFTGEPLPRTCAAGDSVHGGSVNCDGLITVRASGSAAESLLAQIARMVEQARMEQAPVEKLAERVSAAFVPVVWMGAAAAFAYWGWARHDLEQASMSAMALLVAACPCALGIATPMAVSIALGRAAKAGVLVRSGEVLERLPAVKQVFFDKTGTLTDSCVRVAGVVTGEGGPSVDEALAWAASLAGCSEHSASRAIAREAVDRGVSLGHVEDFEVHPGMGVSGTVTLDGETRRVTLGSAALVADLHQGVHSRSHLIAKTRKGRKHEKGREVHGLESGVRSPSVMSDVGSGEPHTAGLGEAGALTTTYAAWDGCVQAAISLQDSVRPDAGAAVRALAGDGIVTAIVSGDREGPVRRVAGEVGIERVYFECSPQAKVEIVREARRDAKGAVVMVGDGINDAPALAEADIGIATGGGTDLARESGDITLLGNELARIPWVLELARRTHAVIRRNLAWAFGYNLVAMGLAFAGWVHPLIAAVAMVISSVTVIGSSVGLGRGSDAVIRS